MTFLKHNSGFPGGSMGKNPPTVQKLGIDPWLGRFPGEGNSNPLQYFAWEIPWTEEPGGLKSWGHKRVRHD